MEPASCPVAPRDAFQNLLDSSGPLRRELRSRLAARDSSKEATRAMRREEGSWVATPDSAKVAAQGLSSPSQEEPTAVWDAVAGYVQEQLLPHKENAEEDGAETAWAYVSWTRDTEEGAVGWAPRHHRALTKGWWQLHRRGQQERLASVRGTQMDFWDGMEHTFMMPSITAEERTAVWDAVAGYVQEQLSLHKGVRIPTLGSFDAVPKRVQVGAEVVTIRKPVFHLARNLAVVHNLMDNKAYLPGNKELEPLKYAKVAAAASVSRCKVEGCIQGTTSLLSHCLGKGHNVALILKDIGLLLIEGTKVQMKFYYDFLQRLSGKQNLEKVIFKVPQLLDMVVSRLLPVASLTFSGRVIIFPKFEMAFVPKPPPRALLETLRRVPGEEQQRRREGLPPLGPGRRVRFPDFPFPATPSSTNNEIPQFWEFTGPRKRKRSGVRQRPVSPVDSSAKKQPATGQRKGKLLPKGQASQRGRAQSYRGEGGAAGGAAGGRGAGGGAGGEEGGEGIVEKILAEIAAMKTAKAKPCRREEAAAFVTPVVAVLSAASSEASLLQEPANEVLRRPPPRPRRPK
ncbi:uncharacterized protein LOC142403144 [Mycteria americana]|uniref:uncharacterized protein LOC142403144 n=1 Tax=Mycteria americana TaxID=33587 RepID=UPI003F5812AC